LVDALASGVSVLTDVGVQVPPLAPIFFPLPTLSHLRTVFFLWILPRWCEGGDLNPHVRKDTNT
jgi:hypothetical protein